MEVKGKVVIVTGASSGIGEATAREFAKEGAKLVLAARRVDRLESLAKEIVAMGGGAEALVVQADLSKLEDIQALITKTLEKYGRIDVLVNNAGFGRLDWLENLDPVKDIQSQFDVNVLGVIQTTRQALPIMIKQRAGHVINMCSMAGLVATPTYTIYAACKHAVHGFSEALRREVKPWGIDVSMIYPGEIGRASCREGVEGWVGVGVAQRKAYEGTRRCVSFLQAEDGIRAYKVTGVQTCALPICAGHVINMCSMAGLVATPTYTIYAACKHAVHGFSEALRREVKPWGIDVSMIYPG